MKKTDPIIAAKLTPEECKLLTLTEIHRLTLRFVCLGLSAKEIAGVRGVTKKTVDKQVETIKKKLSIHDRVRLAHFGIAVGLVPVVTKWDKYTTEILGKEVW